MSADIKGAMQIKTKRIGRRYAPDQENAPAVKPFKAPAEAFNGVEAVAKANRWSKNDHGGAWAGRRREGPGGASKGEDQK
jgi:hypothetical protein